MEIHLFFNTLNSTTEAMTYELLYTEFHFFPGLCQCKRCFSLPKIISITYFSTNILENLGSVLNSKLKPSKHSDAVKHCWQCVKENDPCSAPTTQLWDMKGNLHQTGCSCSSTSNTTR